MSGFDYIGDTPAQILSRFTDYYYSQSGETIRIGSEEYAFASACAYVLSVYLNACDDAALNRYIDTARGGYLDLIAATYGIAERPQGTRASAYFKITSAGTFPIIMPAGSIRAQASGGEVFGNIWDVKLSGSVSYATLYAEARGAQCNGIAPGVWDILAGDPPISELKTTYASAGGVDAMAGDDEAFRAWLKNEIRSFAGAGTAKAYEARAMNADPRVLDAYALRQDDEGYIPGKVQLFIAADTSDGPDVSTILDAVEHSVTADDFRPIGDLVEVDLAEVEDHDAGVVVRTVYEPRFYALAEARNDRILEAYLAELRKKIGAPFCWGEFFARLREADEDGVYATDAIAEGADEYTLAPIQPAPGCVVNVQDLSMAVAILQGKLCFKRALWLER